MRYPNINAERARMGLSWGQLAGILGVTRKTLYNWTTKGDVPQNALIQMTDIFGCSPDYLLSEAVADEEPLTEKQTLFAIRLKPQYEDEFSGGFIVGNSHFMVWSQSMEEAVAAVEKAVGGGANQELYTVEAAPVKAYGVEITRMVEIKQKDGENV